MNPEKNPLICLAQPPLLCMHGGWENEKVVGHTCAEKKTCTGELSHLGFLTAYSSDRAFLVITSRTDLGATIHACVFDPRLSAIGYTSFRIFPIAIYVIYFLSGRSFRAQCHYLPIINWPSMGLAYSIALTLG